MAQKDAADYFVHELPLVVTPADEVVLDKRFHAARALYNACLHEALKRLRRARESAEWKVAREIPREKRKERNAAFAEARRKYGFHKYELAKFANCCRKSCWIGDHVDYKVAASIAFRAFDAVDRYARGQRGRPRFKGRLKSVESPAQWSAMRWCAETNSVVWKGLRLRARLDPKDRYGVEAHALSCPVKIVRIVWRQVGTRRRWYAQLVLEGKPKWKEKNPIGDDIVGIDLGPSTVAVVGSGRAFLEKLCPSVDFPAKEIRRIQRAMDRSRRANNPANYNADGTVRRGAKRWAKSNRYRRLENRLADAKRRLAAARKNEHGRLANRILAIGRTIRCEKLEYNRWQARFGRSIRDRAPGLFLAILRRKAESAGGGVEEFPTRTTRPSRRCQCGRETAKPLALREHRCKCGIVMHRDLYSAYLARFVEDGELRVGRARECWPGTKPSLDATWSPSTREIARRDSSCRRGTSAASGGPSGSHGRRIAETEARIADFRGT